MANLVLKNNASGGKTSVTADNFIGNASTASKWLTARTLTLSGDASGSVSIDGSGNMTLTVAVANDSHTHAWANITGKPSTFAPSSHTHDYLPLTGGTLYSSSTDTPLYIKSNGASAYLGFKNSSGTTLGYFAVTQGSIPVFYDSSAKTLLHSSNYTSYTVTKTGSGASGTWGINISGNAATSTRPYVYNASSGSTYYMSFASTGGDYAYLYRHSSVYFSYADSAWTELFIGDSSHDGWIALRNKSGGYDQITTNATSGVYHYFPATEGTLTVLGSSGNSNHPCYVTSSGVIHATSNAMFAAYAPGAHNANSLVNAGFTPIHGGSNVIGSSYGMVLTLPYRQSYGNSSPDYAAQILLPCGDNGTAPDGMFYRTSTSSWRGWKSVVHSNCPTYYGSASTMNNSTGANLGDVFFVV